MSDRLDELKRLARELGVDLSSVPAAQQTVDEAHADFVGTGMRQIRRVHPQIERPDSVTHFICPEGETIEHRPNVTHKIMASSRCAYCHKTRGQLAREYGVQ